MQTDGYMFMTDCVTKFHRSVYLLGWFYHETDALKSVTLRDPKVLQQISAVQQEHKGVEADLGKNRGFSIQALLSVDDHIDHIELECVTMAGRRIVVTLGALANDRIARYSTPLLLEKLRTLLSAGAAPRQLLDVGGRDRSRVDRRGDYPGHTVTVIDIAAGGNVDVVGDAHCLSDYFAPDQFDAVVSTSVFEHLAMPWKAVIEINRVLKPGGLVLLHTHQTLGMHDLPWDFWRFSDTAWDALFNPKTGFEIIDRALDGDCFVLPHVYRRNKRDAERSVGFEGSTVLARKIGAASVDWPVRLGDILSTSYPLTEDGNTGRDLI
jgi:SAM-dependent methyltransferase